MKKSIKLFVVTIVLLIGGSSHAQSNSQSVVSGGPTATGNASASIIQPITVSATGNLVFGNVLANATGTVTVANNGSKTYSPSSMAPNGNVNSSATDNGASSAAQFTVAGAPNMTFSVGNSGVTNGGSPAWIGMTLNVNTVGTGSLDGTGASSFSEGGTLNVPNGQPVGTYSATWIVTVAYN